MEADDKIKITIWIPTKDGRKNHTVSVQELKEQGLMTVEYKPNGDVVVNGTEEGMKRIVKYVEKRDKKVTNKNKKQWE